MKTRPGELPNTQPVEKPHKSKKGEVWIHSIWQTIQGEGPYQGYPAIFIRVAGCNLMCPGCDTDYTSHRTIYNPQQLVTRVQGYKTPGRLVVITGGEPFRQNITPLVRLLLNTRFPVQIETNGTYYPGDDWPWTKACIVCSPKTPKIHPKIIVDCYKYVLDAEHVDPDDGLPSSALGMPGKPARPAINNVRMNSSGHIPVLLQPMDEQNEEKNTANLTAVMQSCMKFNYRIQLQIHKLLGLP